MIALADFTLNENTCADTCVEKGKQTSKEKHKRKLIKEPKRITCSFLAFCMTMESYEVSFEEMLISDFSYEGTLFYYNGNMDKKTFSWLLEKQRVLSSFFSVTLANQI